ncbi:MAG: Kae1-associated serine/threonine protein kinase [Candidatus Marsarchaeota archaeon]|nr:Kae1-associated serine/threonine protein kinase [Candidatus Marsarchaeota archaeon]
MEKEKKKTEKIILEGAEAVLRPVSFGQFSALDKIRQAKSYRPGSLDLRIRSTRTRVEARLLVRAKEAGVPAPLVLAVGRHDIVMGKLGGKTLNRMEGGKIPAPVWKLAGKYLAKLHGAGIVHGDYTPANLMLDGKNGENLAVIDFGLGSTSHDSEDFAVDVLTMKKALKGEKAQAAFLAGYKSEGNARVLKLMAEVEKRARYQDRGG